MSIHDRLVALLVLLAAGSGCGSSRETPPTSAEAGAGTGEQLPYQVMVTIVGEPSAFAGRSLEVGGHVLQPVTSRPDRWHAEQQLCTGDRDRFLQSPLRVAVREGERLLADAPLARTACAGLFAAGGPQPSRGWTAHLTLVLGADGSLSLDPVSGTTCGTTGALCVARPNVSLF